LQAALTGGGIGVGKEATGTVGVRGSMSNVAATPVEKVHEVPAPTALTPTAPPKGPLPPQPDREEGDDARVTGMRVPATAGTLVEWANLWIRMCSDGVSALGPLNDEDARTSTG
jgi:hypothetical protein